MTRKQKIDQIARKAANTLTEAEKLYIVRLSAKLGIEFVPRPHCSNCYSDQAIVLRMAVFNADSAQQREPAYILREGIDVIYLGIRVNKHTLTDQLAEQLLAKGFERRFFAKCK